MELPADIRQIVEREASRYPLGRLIDISRDISGKYRENLEGGASGKPLVSGREAAVVYAAVRMPATYAAAARVLELVSRRCGDGFRTLLDAGAGCGAVSRAAFETFGGLEKMTCIEREKGMLELGEMIMRETGLSCPFTWELSDAVSAELGSAELVCAAYLLNEIKTADREKLTRRLWEASEKLLVIIEPGTPAAFAKLRETARLLRSLGAVIAAPCPDTAECPLPSDDWCCFTARTARSALHKRLKGGDAPYEDEKFCFIAAAREGVGAPCAARVIRHPMIESGKVALKLCGSGGITEKTVTKKDGADFKKARKSDAGDEFSA